MTRAREKERTTAREEKVTEREVQRLIFVDYESRSFFFYILSTHTHTHILSNNIVMRKRFFFFDNFVPVFSSLISTKE